MMIFTLSLLVTIIIIFVFELSASWVIKFQGLKLAILLTEARKFVPPIRVSSCYNCPFSVLLIYCFVVCLAAPFQLRSLRFFNERSTFYILIYILRISRLMFVCYLARQPPVGQGLLIHKVSRSYTTTGHSR
jgi:hypothetical protein